MKDARAFRHDLASYVVGLLLALALTGAAFAVIAWRVAHALPIVFALGLLQIIVHFRCFLHVDFRQSARADLQLILFSTVIIGLMVGGTLVILFNLRYRMM